MTTAVLRTSSWMVAPHHLRQMAFLGQLPFSGLIFNQCRRLFLEPAPSDHLCQIVRNHKPARI